MACCSCIPLIYFRVNLVYFYVSFHRTTQPHPQCSFDTSLARRYSLPYYFRVSCCWSRSILASLGLGIAAPHAKSADKFGDVPPTAKDDIADGPPTANDNAADGPTAKDDVVDGPPTANNDVADGLHTA